jgi:hypothetical protein
LTPIEDIGITIQETWVSSFGYEYEIVAIGYTLDSETVRDSIIFNLESSEIEICHVATLADAPNVVDGQVLKIFVGPPHECGPLPFFSDSYHIPQLTSTSFQFHLGIFAGLFGDPHIMTFDEQLFDCQATGEFTTLTSLENNSF